MFALQVERVLGVALRTGVLHMHRLIIMTMSAGVGETFATLVWDLAPSTEEQLLAYQMVL